MIETVPNGTVICSIKSFSEVFQPPFILPIGSSRRTTWFNPSIMSFILTGFSDSRSTRASFIPPALAFSTSTLFAASISLLAASIAPAAFSSAKSLAFRSCWAKTACAAFSDLNTFSREFIVNLFITGKIILQVSA